MSLTTHEPRAVERMPETASASEGIMTQILRVASDPSIDLDRMDKLMVMHERLRKDQAEREFATALAELQGELPLIAQGGFDKHKGVAYARLEDVLRAVRPAMQRHGFSIGFDIATEQNAVMVTGTLTHSAGHSRSTTRRYPIDTGPGRNAIQAMGSSETYGRRYVMMSLLNIAPDKDDDGKAARVDDGPEPEKITSQQVGELRALLKQVGKTEEAFLRHLGLATLDDIFADKFFDAVQLLRRTGAKR